MIFDLAEAVRDISQSCGIESKRVHGAVELLSEGNTIPFIARYRKERTGGLDEAELRTVEDQLNSARELADRKETILKTIGEQGKLDDSLRAKIFACSDRKTLEEIYLPYKPKRRTRATIARERGLDPLAELLRSETNPNASREAVLAPFVDANQGVEDAAAALQGACDIIAEEWAEVAEVRAEVREELERGFLVSKAKRGWQGKPSKFEAYYDYREAAKRVPSHRYLAMRRGEAEDTLKVGIAVEGEGVVRRLVDRLVKNRTFLFHKELVDTVADCYERLLFPASESAYLADLKDAADDDAITVFSQNLRELLLAPPAGARVVLGIDPGFRTGCKLVVVDATGKFLENTTIYPTPPRNQTAESERVVLDIVERHSVELIAIGNGTASRETDAFASNLLKKSAGKLSKVVVNESGASIYSASDVARAEFPDLDLTVRGAISIARRLQDPLAELVKIDPKSIGVGQYQHDVNQTRLRKALAREVESCVNLVGVNLNTASAHILSYVAGIGPKLGEAIVQQREANGPFPNRQALLSVPRLGSKAFEQSAGFLRVRGGTEPLDNSAVHPESYRVVKAMAKSTGIPARDLIGNRDTLSALDAHTFVDGQIGLPTVEDILNELEKPGRDPRREFQVPRFTAGVNEISNLEVDMVLEGVVTNVTRFGAFVDIGVHQDGLVHVSELDRKFVNDPSDVVSVGDIVRVKVLSVELERKRIALSRKQLL